MSKEDFLKILGEYVDKDELDRYKSMLSKSKKDYLTDELNHIRLVEKSQTIAASISLNGSLSKASSFQICTITVNNPNSINATIQVIITLDHGLIVKKKIDLSSDVRKDYLIDLNDHEKDLLGYVDKVIDCNVKVLDEYERELASSFGEVSVTDEGLELDLKISAELKKIDDLSADRVHIADVNIRSNETREISCECVVKVGNNELVSSPCVIQSKAETSCQLYVSGQSLKTHVGKQATLFVSYKSKDLFSRSFPITDPASVDPGDGFVPSKKKISAECITEKIIDIHKFSNNIIELGKLVVKNDEPREESVFCRILLNDVEVQSFSKSLPSKSKISVGLEVPINVISKDDTYNSSLKYILYDSNRETVLSRMTSITVRSKFDLDLRQVVVRTAEFITPLSPGVKDFVTDRSGPLSRAMGSNYIVCGYQSESKILTQLDGVWNAVVRYGMSYVSDTKTLRSDSTAYQRVRYADKVLKDHTGNCIELSILFASMFETMGFEPVVIFPYGHAIVGVVLRTDAYATSSKCPDVLSRYLVRLNLDGRYVDALPIESTCCPDKSCRLLDAVASAKSTIDAELSTINAKKDFTIVKLLRNKGIKPVVE